MPVSSVSAIPAIGSARPARSLTVSLTATIVEVRALGSRKGRSDGGVDRHARLQGGPTIGERTTLSSSMMHHAQSVMRVKRVPLALCSARLCESQCHRHRVVAGVNGARDMVDGCWAWVRDALIMKQGHRFPAGSKLLAEANPTSLSAVRSHPRLLPRYLEDASVGNVGRYGLAGDRTTKCDRHQLAFL